MGLSGVTDIYCQTQIISHHDDYNAESPENHQLQYEDW